MGNFISANAVTQAYNVDWNTANSVCYTSLVVGAAEQPKKIENNLAWLDRRVNEMRIAL